MSKRLLKIDTTILKDKANDNLVRIKFSSEDFLQVNFTNFFFQSKYIRDKYKYYEALDSFQDEIDEIENKFHINERSLKYFIQLIDEEKVNIPIEHYKDIYTLSGQPMLEVIIHFLRHVKVKSFHADVTNMVSSYSAVDLVKTFIHQPKRQSQTAAHSALQETAQVLFSLGMCHRQTHQIHEYINSVDNLITTSL